MSTSPVWQKVGASTINCTLILFVMLPFYPMLPLDQWKIATILSFFTYNACFRTRCLGMRVVGTYPINPPISIFYVLAYTSGFATFFYDALIPFDLLTFNAIALIGSVMMTGNTWYGNLAGQGTMSREQYLTRCQNRARLMVMEGNALAAVHNLAADLGKYPETAIPPYLIDVGIAIATEPDHAHRDIGVFAWIDGFK